MKKLSIIIAGLAFWLSPLFIEVLFWPAAAAMLLAGGYLVRISHRKERRRQ